MVTRNIAVLFRMPCGTHMKTRQIMDLTGNFQALRPIRLPRFRRGNARLSPGTENFVANKDPLEATLAAKGAQ